VGCVGAVAAAYADQAKPAQWALLDVTAVGGTIVNTKKPVVVVSPSPGVDGLLRGKLRRSKTPKATAPLGDWRIMALHSKIDERQKQQWQELLTLQERQVAWLERLCKYLPFFTRYVAHRQKGHRPEQGAGIGKEGEDSKRELGRPGNIGRQMPDTREKISEHQAPLPPPCKPRLQLCRLVGGEVDEITLFMEQGQAQRPPEAIAEGNATHTATNRADYRGDKP
jgi:hypothetical protein